MTIGRIVSDLKTAEWALNIPETNPLVGYFCDVAAVHVWKAACGTLQYLLAVGYGKISAFGIQSVANLLDEVEGTRYDWYKTEHQKLYQYADKMDSWEYFTRYGDEVITNKEEVTEALECIKSLLQEVNGIITMKMHDSISSKVGDFTAGVMENQKYDRFLDLDD